MLGVNYCLPEKLVLFLFSCSVAASVRHAVKVKQVGIIVFVSCFANRSRVLSVIGTLSL